MKVIIEKWEKKKDNFLSNYYGSSSFCLENWTMNIDQPIIIKVPPRGVRGPNTFFNEKKEE